jgi:hypothetical protein
MLPIFLGVIAGFFGWVILWVTLEKILCALWPAGFGVHQRAFEEALTKGGPFTANTRMLVIHIFLCCLVSMLSGFLTAMISGETSIAPLVLSALLLALGVLKAVMSWSYVPLWYHLIFTGLLVSMAILGSKLYIINY